MRNVTKARAVHGPGPEEIRTDFVERAEIYNRAFLGDFGPKMVGDHAQPYPTLTHLISGPVVVAWYPDDQKLSPVLDIAINTHN
jgi:hypothetical protein